LPDRTRTSLIAIAALATAMASPLSVHATTSVPKVVIIVGPTGSGTAYNRSAADSLAAAAAADGATVVKVYSPNATWANVKAAVNGANLIVYLGHGNGFPNPYSTTYYPDRVDGWGLNRTTTNGDGDNWSTTMVYCGEKALMGTLTSTDGAAQRQYCGGSSNTDGITPAPGFVMVYSNACYAPGASEPGTTPGATEAQALARVGYYSRPVLATLAASAYFATDHGATSIVHAILTRPTTTYGELYAAQKPSVVTVTNKTHPFIAGDVVKLGKRSTDPYYTYAFAGNPALTFASGGSVVPPRIVARAPASGATNVSMTPAITVRFSEAVTGVSANNMVLRRGSTVIASSVTYNAATFTAVLRPTKPLAPAAPYGMALSSRIKDANGNPLAWTSWTFTTTRTETYTPVRTLQFAPGTYTGYRFSSTGAVTARRSYTLSSSSNAPTSKRSAIPAHTGGWYYVTAGVWAGYWVPEGTGITLR
jgi:hypothetical protein